MNESDKCTLTDPFLDTCLSHSSKEDFALIHLGDMAKHLSKDNKPITKQAQVIRRPYAQASVTSILRVNIDFS